MLTVADRSIQKAGELIAAEVKRLIEIVEVASPIAIPDYAAFRYYAGQVHGLHVAEQLIKEAIEVAEQEASGRTTTKETQ